MLALDTWIWFSFWLVLGALFSFERLVTVWHGGWQARLLALTVVPELVFDMFRNEGAAAGREARPAVRTPRHPPGRL